MKKYLFLLMVVVFFQIQNGYGQSSTSFTYQGSLINNSTPANGNFDFEFALFSAVSGGTQLGTTNSVSNVAVANGIFTVQLNFGDQFGDTPRFLEIRVRQTGGGTYTTLAPRQEIRTAPYSIRSNISETSLNAQQLGGIPASGFIQNTTTQQSSTNFNIGGTGTANIFNATTQFSIGGNRVFSLGGTDNTFVGIGTGAANTGNRNSFFGKNSGLVNTSGASNSFFGVNSGDANTTGGENSFFGDASGSNNTVGNQNSAFGRLAGQLNVSGNENASFGYGAGQSATTSFNSFFGSQAGRFTSTGGSNSFFGASAGLNNNAGSDNSFFGVNTGLSNQTGNGNSFFGRRAGRDNTQGSNNTLIEIDAGRGNLTGNNNTAIGAGADFAFSNMSFATAIGAGAVVNASNRVVIGRSIDSVRIPGTTFPAFLQIDGTDGHDFLQNLRPALNGDPQVCLSALAQPLNYALTRCSSSIRFKENVFPFGDGMRLLKQLRPVTYNWKSSGQAAIGLIAEEVNEVDTRLSEREENGEVYGVKFNSVTAVVVSAVQEQQTQIEAQQKQIDEQKELIKQQQEQLNKQQKEIEALKLLVCSQNPTAQICREER